MTSDTNLLDNSCRITQLLSMMKSITHEMKESLETSAPVVYILYKVVRDEAIDVGR